MANLFLGGDMFVTLETLSVMILIITTSDNTSVTHSNNNHNKEAQEGACSFFHCSPIVTMKVGGYL